MNYELALKVVGAGRRARPKEANMNNNFEEKLFTAAKCGLEARIPSEPSSEALAVVKACAAKQARHIRFIRAVRRIAVMTAPLAACAALVVMTIFGNHPLEVQAGEGINLKPLAALIALTTVVSDYDADVSPDSSLLLTDVEYNSDFASLTASIVQMQDSACLLNHAITQN